MDAGTAAVISAAAAVLGAAVGAGAALGQARLTGRIQGRNQYDQWRREGRREAYSSLIGKVAAYQHEAEMMFTAVTKIRDSASVSDLHELRRRLPDLLQQIHDRVPPLRAAAPVVAVEGPGEVAKRADRIVRQVETITADLGRVAVEDVVDEERGTGIGVTVPAGAISTGLDRLARELEGFTDEARRSLDGA